MREYRARRRVQPQLEALAETFGSAGKIARAADPVVELSRQLAEAQEEIRHLKRELAQRSTTQAVTAAYMNQIETASIEGRRARQAVIDETLRKVNRKTGPK
jgi:hypothetical protein